MEAHADGTLKTTADGVVAKVVGKKQAQARPSSNSTTKSQGPTKSRFTYLPKDEYKAQMTAYRQKLQSAVEANKQVQAAFVECINTVGTTSCGAFRQSALPDQPDIRAAGDPAAAAAAPAAPAVTPEQAAYIASARLHLAAPKPVVGPPPEINEWGMAAVGYPLWLSAEGDLDPAPVADSVFDLAVSLDARLVEVVFDMGDGHRVRCRELTTRWTRSVEPGATSPSCGYAYQEPSLPEGLYTVTANAVWAIDWSINGTTGSIPFYQSASTEVPVGELQVLVR
ncbi:hypothetical protein SAMN04488543_2216 [Friedmanniella luteola]|uniref:Uncharacterized protein n=1 Tax=Friedmanniella luteola TaxID=546871 RepID=A0A1H1UAY5_9ACTN|nr:hypothetical protein [Friedmanniella luteola]SDS69635.1 hypothetical protein SAMN04488543_2216 [Friedmanniella luteola]